MEIKKAKQTNGIVLTGTHPLKCKVCNSWTKKQPDKTRLCVTCHFRNKAKEQAAILENPDTVVNPNIRIGKL